MDAQQLALELVNHFEVWKKTILALKDLQIFNNSLGIDYRFFHIACD
jgi:hypothetical protein